VSCVGQHKIFLGTACPSCGTDIPYGPYGWSQYEFLFGKAINEPPIREPSPAHVAAQAAYVAADRARTQAYSDVVRLEDQLAKAQMSSTEITVSGGVRNKAPDSAQVARLTEQVAAARENRATADERTARALKTANRIRA